ncbi:MAG TPA: MFS transporter [Chthonomonadaceae bacterium]|nr:MFS transporter [Chthonomonadaceae bacterium]
MTPTDTQAPAGKEASPTPDAQRPAPSYKWAVVGMLWFICFFNYADRQAIFSIFPVLESQFGFNKEQLGRIGAAFTIVYAVTAPFAGQVGDRFARKAVILGGLYIWSLVTGFTALCSKVWQFVLVRGAEGLGETFYFPASMSLISDYHTRATRSRAMSLHQTSVYAGTIGGGALAGWMAQQFGWRSPFLVFAVAGVLLGLALAAFIREPQRNEAERLEQGALTEESVPPQLPMSQFLRDLARTPTALTLIVAFFGANLVALVFLTWMPSFLKEKFHLNLAQAGLGATVFIQLASMIGATFGGVLADRWRRQMAGGRILTQALGAILGAPFIFLCGYTRDLWTLVGAMTLFGLCKGLYDANIWASLYDVVAPSRRGAAVGLMNMIGWLGGALGAYAIGAAVQGGMTMSAAISSTALIYVAVAALLVTGALVFAPRDVRS